MDVIFLMPKTIQNNNYASVMRLWYALTQGLPQADMSNSDNEVYEIISPVCESRLIVCNVFTPINQGASNLVYTRDANKGRY